MDAYVDKCRMCLSDGAEGISIFAQGEQENYSEVILQIFEIKLDKMDNWPSNACGDCIRVMDSIVNLKTKVYSTQEHLRRIALEAQTVKLKDEVVEEVDMATSHDYQEEVPEDEEETVKMECEEPSDDIPKPEPDEFNQRSRRSSRVKKEVIRPTPPPPPPASKEDTPPRRQEKKKKQSKSLEKQDESKDKSLLTERTNEAYAKLTLMLKEMNLLNCKECLIEFDSVPSLQTHTETVHKKSKCYIVCCERKIYRHSIYDHMRYHLDKTLFECKICNVAYLCKRTLDLHERNKHGVNARYVCEHCGRKCSSKNFYELHLISHIPTAERELKFECTMCDKKYAFSSSYETHVRDVHRTSVLSFMCEKCGKACVSQRRLDNHISVKHSGKEKEPVKKKKCDECQKYYSCLSVHLKRTHGKKQPVTCEICGKEYTTASIKNHHKFHHSGQKFTCEICHKDFKLQEVYKVHMNKHMGIKCKCYFCPFESTDSGNRAKHMRAKHPKEFEDRLANRRKTAD